VGPLKDRVSLLAPAKINLYLKITGRRADGYHYLATLMQKISLFDQVVLERRPKGVLLLCPDSDLPVDDANIAYRAASLFLEQKKNVVRGKMTGVAIILNKSIPVAAGLGGGSSDAAAVIRGLDELFAASCTEEEMLGMGASLGADVPFFVSGKPAAWATGIGDRLHEAAPLTGYSILIVNPGYSVSTQWVYEKFALTAGINNNNLQNFEKLGAEGERQNVYASRSIKPEELVNDLESVTAGYHQEVMLLKNRLVEAGAAEAMMTGSGPTVFGLFRTSDAEKAAACAQALKAEFKDTYLVDPLPA